MENKIIVNGVINDTQKEKFFNYLNKKGFKSETKPYFFGNTYFTVYVNEKKDVSNLSRYIKMLYGFAKTQAV